ncbi:hypothetical protein DFH27DRAFT_200157 [Peziza echinospora]|nr:hypothetical protein DFH27DRAFT_200157 [Peziza echinospora]
MAGRPKVASIDNDSVLQALQCSICRKCIRSPFFECTEGCLDLESPKNHYKCTPNPTNPSANITHLIPRLQPTPFRSCSTCTTTTTTANAAPASPPPHPRAHLKITSSTSDYDSPRAACVAFSRELDALEDLASGRAGAIASLAAMVAMRVTRGGVRRRFLPAGNVHLAYRFGTLVVESGVPHSQGGVLATTREPQQLLFTPYTQHTSMLTGENDIPLTHTPKLALSPSRHVFTKPQDPRDAARRVLAVVKQVCANPLGGGGVHETDDMDTTLPLPLPALLAAAATAYATHNPLLPLATKRAALNASAGEMLRVVKRLIGGDVESQIRVISETLMMVRKGGGGGGVDLTWHPLHNNCQRFCNALLHAERDFCTAEYMEGSPSPRHYTHSFAGATTFPLAHKSGDLRRSEDLPAYLTTLHPTTSLLTFSLTRKLWRGPELANMALDPTLFDVVRE